MQKKLLKKTAFQERGQAKTVYVAMSGGVDSSVATALLKQQGYNVTGVFMRPWSPEIRNTKYEIRNTNCMWQGDREDALRVASTIGIPLLTWDFSKEYKKEVGDYMLREYKAGRTPNPDVMCNKEIKFGLFLKQALKEGADYIATGHYVRLKTVISNSKLVIKDLKKLPITNYQLHTAKDTNKDQSYFLWTLTQKQLKHCLFPIGNYTKPEVRKLAKKFGLPNHDKKDSQGVCFIGPLDMKDFLKKYIKPKSGNIIDMGGRIIGCHDGVYYYTIGQRHGLDIKNGQGPYYVTGKDIKKNIIFVGKEKDLGGKEAKITAINWINPTWKLSFQVKGSVEIDVKIRYRSKSEKAVLSKSIQQLKRSLELLNKNNISENYRIKFLKPVRAITPGQSAVFYRGQEMLGGGIIE
ncbi:MAG: tRNA 2-thiouridine(34) synthase MnmA [Candidatus Taylorbacteria bacterium]|nr:tRNA 2-thiouridine(34) synthase MnmA [Candidatus Taylorbacteria bacterium]